jgi:methionyl-tRNA formyltransferase
LRIAVAATPDVAIASLDSLLVSDHELAFVITQPDRLAGRGRELKQSEVADWAQSKSIDCFKPNSADEFITLAKQVELVITIGYGKILSRPELEAPARGCINLHFSLLPKWRGAAPVQRAIEAGDVLSGVTIFQLDEGMDTGPIYLSKRFALDEDISADELLKELSELGSLALMESLEMITSNVSPTTQKSADASRAAKLSKSEGEIDWNLSAKVISQKIRAFTSNPGAWTTFRGSTLKIDSPKIEDFSLRPGELSVADKKLYVGTSTSAISLGFITAQGKSRVTAGAWSNGARIQSGDRFG